MGNGPGPPFTTATAATATTKSNITSPFPGIERDRRSVGTIRRTRDHPKRQGGSASRTRDRRMRTLQTNNQNVALHPLPDATHEYEIDSPSKRPTAPVPLSTRDPPIPNLSPHLLTEVIPYEGGPWPTFRDLLVPLATRKAKSLESERPEGSVIASNTGFLQEAL